MAVMPRAPWVESVFHPSDFSEASAHAFVHALAIALLGQTELVILHAGREYLAEDEWVRFPPVRATLERWGLLPEGSPRSALLDELRVRVKKINMRRLTPLAAMSDYLERHPTDLIVLATAGRHGLPRWIHPSRAEKLARRSHAMTLFVPDGAHGIVSLDDGEISLRRILVPIDHRPSPRAALALADRVARLEDPPVEIRALHVGEPLEMPAIPIDGDAGRSWQLLNRRGDVVEEILRAAERYDVNLIVMATLGHDGFLDALRGSVTEQVLRRAPCPLLAVPAGRRADPPGAGGRRQL